MLRSRDRSQLVRSFIARNVDAQSAPTVALPSVHSASHVRRLMAMSKVIYLDGTETLVYTQRVLDPTYVRESPLERWEILLLHAFLHASLYTGNTFIADFVSSGVKRPHPRELMQKIDMLKKTFGLQNRNLCEIESYHDDYVKIKVRNTIYSKNIPSDDDYFQEVLRPPWLTPTSIP